MPTLRIHTAVSLLMLVLLAGCIASVNKETIIASAYSNTSPSEALLFIEPTTLAPNLQGRVSPEALTQNVVQAFQQMGAKLTDSKDEADYIVQPVITNLTDLFDNIVHSRIDIKTADGRSLIYSSTFVGIEFTQPASMSLTSKEIVKSSAEIYASINKDFEENGGALPPQPSFTAYSPAPRNEATLNAVNTQGMRYALIIGNGTYRDAPLKNPLNDARDIATTLRQLGFNVIRKTNASLREMDQALDQFYASLRRGGVGLFYYAGHGMQVGGRNYLIPIGATIKTESDVRYECLDAERVLGKMEDAGNTLNIVILDACRNNPFARSFRSARSGLARMDAPTGSIVAYATAPGSVAADGSGRNGIYTKHLLQYLATPGLDISDIFFYTRKDVVQETNGQQVPWESSSLINRFYFQEKPQ